jgi:hypothetical protein
LRIPDEATRPGVGTPKTGGFDGGIYTQSVSYGYPAGMSVAPINPVVIDVR